jgi:hypothetical protein
VLYSKRSAELVIEPPVAEQQLTAP